MAREILGKSRAVGELLKLIGQVSASKTNVLILGESGTGKELVARMIHDSGPLRSRPFIPVNCGAIPEALIESEMFGHKRGSFTGAVVEKSGLFEAANTGTLFLDEVGELPVGMQVKLLRAIQERVFRKVGGNEDIRVDVRIIAATNRDLEAAVAKGTFREDLYYRLNVLLIRTPPLRDREGDVRLLAQVFIEKFARAQGKENVSIHPEALDALEAYHWPGNIRELENVIERAVTLAGQGRFGLDALPGMIRERFESIRRLASEAGDPAPGGKVPGARASPGSRGPTPSKLAEIQLPAPDFSNGSIDFEGLIGEAEKAYILAALEHAGGKRKAAAELLRINLRSLRYKMSRLGMDGAEEPAE